MISKTNFCCIANKQSLTPGRLRTNWRRDRRMYRNINGDILYKILEAVFGTDISCILTKGYASKRE